MTTHKIKIAKNNRVYLFNIYNNYNRAMLNSNEINDTDEENTKHQAQVLILLDSDEELKQMKCATGTKSVAVGEYWSTVFNTDHAVCWTFRFEISMSECCYSCEVSAHCE